MRTTSDAKTKAMRTSFRKTAKSQIVIATKTGRGAQRSGVSPGNGKPFQTTRGLRVHMTRTKADARQRAPKARTRTPSLSWLRVNCAWDSELARKDPIQLRIA